MERRGLSEVVVVVLIILISVASVVTIWLFIQPVLKNSLSDLNSNPYLDSPDFKIVKGSVRVYTLDSSKFVEFIVQRKSQSLNSSSFYITIFDKDGNSFVNYPNIRLEELESETVVIDYTNSGLLDLAKISIISYIVTSDGTTKNSSIMTNINDDFPETILANGNQLNAETDSWFTTPNPIRTTPTPIKTYLYDWDIPVDALNNFVPFAWVTWNEPWRTNGVEGSFSKVSGIKQLTDAMPEGHRVLFNWNLHQDISHNSSDNCRNSSGYITYTNQSGTYRYNCIWWDNGAEMVRTRVDNFFSNYSAIGGKVDYLVLDVEEGMNAFYADARLSIESGVILQDLRYPALAAKLSALGFSDTNHPERIYSSNLTDQLIWNYIMNKETNKYITDSICAPLWKYYPNATCSNFANYYVNDSYRVWDPNWYPRLTHDLGSIVGNEQAPGVYGSLGNVKLISLDNFEKYWPNDFNAFRMDTNIARSAVLSSNVKVTPWFPWKEHSLDPSSGTYITNDLYYDNYLHILMTTSHNKVLYWDAATYIGNPMRLSNAEANISQTKVSNTLKQFDEILGFSDRRTLVTNLSWWGDDYVLTGMYANGRNVWRFTPRLDNSAYGTMNINDVLVKSNPATFKTWKHTITIPEGTVYQPSSNLFNTGYWIFQPVGAPLPIVQEISNQCLQGGCSLNQNGLVGYWSFDNTLADSKSSSAFVGPSYYVNSGGIGNSLNAASGNWQSSTSSALSNLNINNSFTINLMFNTNTSQAFSTILYDSDVSGLTLGPRGVQGWALRFSTGYTDFLMNSGSSGNSDTVACYGDALLNDSKWHMFTVVYDSQLKMIYCYNDGYLVDYPKSTSNIKNISTRYSAIIPGMNGNSYYNDLMLFNRSLNAAEVRFIYNYESSRLQDKYYRI